MNFEDLLDLLFDETTITLFDIDKGENFAEDLSVDEAREWFRTQNELELASINIEKENNVVCNFTRTE